MMTINDLKNRLRASHKDLPFLGDLVDILLAECQPGAFFVPTMFSKKLGKTPQEIYKALHVVSGSPHDLLRVHWIFHDQSDQRYDVDSADVIAAESEGVFYHPDTGEQYSDYRSRLRMQYDPTEKLMQLALESEVRYDTTHRRQWEGNEVL